jgi:AcrR family transcriptional regulator
MSDPSSARPTASERRDPRIARHAATKARILKEAWKLARRDGLGALSLGELAKRVGLRQPSLYTYFDSKLGLYDAMFAEGNQQLWDSVAARPYPKDPRQAAKELAKAIVSFYAEDVTRAELLFHRPIPGFIPTEEAYAPAVRFLRWAKQTLARAGIARDRDFDAFTAIVAGLADQQTANDPGGDRWLRLVDDVVDMLLDKIAARPTRSR